MAWDKDSITRLIEVEAQLQGVDPHLALAVAQQESSLDPNNPGDSGASRGVFHLQRKAAIDAGIDPAKRDDPGTGIFGGVRYLKQQLDRSKGHIPTALSYYNRGTPDYRGIGDPDYVYHVMRHYPEHPLGKAPDDQAAYRARLNQTFGRGTAPEAPGQHPGILARVGTALSPGSAEAATPPQAAPRSRLEDIEAELARREGQPAPAAPQAVPGTSPAPPTATSTPEQDAASRASRGTQGTPPVSQAAPTAQTQPGASQGPLAPETSWTPGMRFQALPSITQLEPADRVQKTTLFASLDPQSQEAFLRSEEPGTRQPSARERFLALPSIASLPEAEREAAVHEFQGMQTTQQEEIIKMEQPGYWQKRPGMTVPGASATESLTAPSTMIPLLMPGAGLKAVKPLVAQAGPLITRGARAVAEGLSQTLGWTAGRTAETGAVPSPGEIGTEAAFNVAAGGILEGLGATGQAILRRSQAGKAIVAADEATTAARQEFEQATALAKAEQQAGRTEAYQAAERRAREAQVRYQTKVEARDATIAANQQEYQEALTASRAEVQAEQARRYGQARTETMEETATAQARRQQYQQAVTGQEQALTQARAVPGQYQPQTPSWVQYEKFGDAAKDAVVDLTPAKAALAEVRASRGVLPDGTARPFPAAVESIAANLEKATGETSFKTIREELRRLGPLARSQDGNVREAAKQLYGIYADVLEASPVANELLRNANATFRKEMAVQDVAEWLTPGRGIVRIDNQGRETINVGALMTRLEKTVADDSLFRRSFASDELDALRADLRRLAGTPTMPRGTLPPAATPELLPGAAPNIPASMTTPTPKTIPPEVPRPRVEMLPGGAGPGRRGPALPAEPTPVTPREALGERPRFTPTEGQLGAVGGLAYLAQLFGIPAKAVAMLKAGSMVSKQLRYGTARMILGAQSRPQLMETLRTVQGRVGPPLYGTVLHGLSAAERKALQRETREQKR